MSFLKIIITRDWLTMKLFKISLSLSLSLSFALLLSLPLTAFADNCVWTNSVGVLSSSSANVNYFCTINGAVVATKTVSTKAVGASVCSISLNSGVYNKGTCDSPNITTSACPNSGVVYGVFPASQWSNNVNSFAQFCGACGYDVTIATPPGANETHLRITCR